MNPLYDATDHTYILCTWGKQVRTSSVGSRAGQRSPTEVEYRVEEGHGIEDGDSKPSILPGCSLFGSSFFLSLKSVSFSDE